MYNVNIIYSASLDKYYVGYTHDIIKRVNQHNLGISTYTSKPNDWVVLYTESYTTRIDASTREKIIKKKKSRVYIKWLIEQQNK